MTEQTLELDMGMFIDLLNSRDEEAELKVRVLDGEAETVNSIAVHAYGGDHYEMAFHLNTGVKGGGVSLVSELIEKLEDYTHSSMDDYGGTYWHDSESLVFFAEYGEYGGCNDNATLRPVAVEEDESGAVIVVIDAVEE